MRAAAVAPTLLRRPQMHTRKRATGSQHVAIVSANPETLDGLQTYLQSAGVGARGTRRLEDCADLKVPATISVVLFPDDFATESVHVNDDSPKRRAPRVYQ
ncbi:MAG: hypothetical protein JWP97_5875 [Labilithrix sp.]|nr:hypothetical protein [Labilithrix sp.]